MEKSMGSNLYEEKTYQMQNGVNHLTVCNLANFD